MNGERQMDRLMKRERETDEERTDTVDGDSERYIQRPRERQRQTEKWMVIDRYKWMERDRD